MIKLALLAVLLVPQFVPQLAAQAFFTYVGQIESRSVLIAWGAPARTGNTIGRASTSQGKARLTIADRNVDTTQNWTVVNDLQPGTDYPFQLAIDGKKMGEGKVRTNPEKASKLCFFVIGDFGTGTAGEYRIGEAMWKEFQKREGSDKPPRFVLTTGDNVYADVNVGFAAAHSGDEDAHWEAKFFKPFEPLLQRIPFYPTLGNHDGNGTENRGDLPVYLDNFFFPGNKPARWYTFSFGDLAQFFALDSTDNSEEGPKRPVYAANGEEFRWLRQVMPASKALWKIPYFHHPIYNAGPRHPNSYEDLKHFVDLFRESGVAVIFNGHEHNFQFSERNEATGNMR
ncbi:MAG: metallophosphoesterase, partial [Acidobacteriota bacterium]|nr:metallophosphoesterase [Acidobacteriota bacterium]